MWGHNCLNGYTDSDIRAFTENAMLRGLALAAYRHVTELGYEGSMLFIFLLSGPVTRCHLTDNRWNSVIGHTAGLASSTLHPLSLASTDSATHRTLLATRFLTEKSESGSSELTDHLNTQVQR